MSPFPGQPLPFLSDPGGVLVPAKGLEMTLVYAQRRGEVGAVGGGVGLGQTPVDVDRFLDGGQASSRRPNAPKSTDTLFNDMARSGR